MFMQIETMAQIRSALGRAGLLLRRKPIGVIGVVMLVALAVTAIFADLIATHNPLVQNLDVRLESPNGDFFFGTDALGRDVFSRVVHGSRISLAVGVIAVAVATALGVTIGLIAGYAGGKLDLAIQRIVDGLMAFPMLVLALIMVAALAPSTKSVLLAIVVAATPQMIRLARAEALKARSEMYVTAAKAVGAGPLRILARHVLPNTAGPIAILGASLLEQAIVAEASLSFLGLGVPPPDPSWGRTLREGTGGFLEAAPWMTIFPAAALTLAVFSFAVIGDAVRDVLDPRFLTRGPRG